MPHNWPSLEWVPAGSSGASGAEWPSYSTTTRGPISGAVQQEAKDRIHRCGLTADGPQKYSHLVSNGGYHHGQLLAGSVPNGRHAPMAIYTSITRKAKLALLSCDSQ